MSSLSFIGNNTSYISIPNDVKLNFETQNFTVEWYQYQTDVNSFPRIFQKGTYTSATVSIGVSIEGGRFYYWSNNTPILVTTLATSAYKNKWVHFAICRYSGTTTVYMNGNSIFSISDTYNYTNTANLVISNESTLSTAAAFGGYMYYFHYVKGFAKYTSNFSVSYEIPALLSESVLLLTATGATGTLGNTITTTAGIFSSIPLPPPPPPPQTPVIIPKRMNSLFTDNSRVYYKSNSLPSSGTGSVRNHRIKARRT